MTLSGQTKRGDMTSGNLDLFKVALGLEDPWKVTRTDFNPEGGRLDLYLDFPRGAAFLLPSRWLWAEGVSGARRRGQAVAPSRLLSARGLHACSFAAGALPSARGAPGQRLAGCSWGG